MPEGDTIFRAARTLNKALAGKKIVRFESALPRLNRIDEDTPLAGRTVESVTSIGKWSLMRFSGDLVLVTHMLMNGSWHIYRPGEPWQKRRSDARVVIETDEFVAVAFNVPIAEFHTEESLRRKGELRHLGQDVLAEDFDPQAALQALKASSSQNVGAALLDQGTLAGIGNVYKSEICFACKVNPFAPVSSLTDDQLHCLVEHARKFMRANVSDTAHGGITTYTGFRRTTGRSNPAERLWVYGRRGLPCRRCGARIEGKKQGPDARVTFWCPKCQIL